MPQLILASASAARLKLLQTLGINPLVEHSNFDESQISVFNPSDLVKTLARKKAEVVADRFSEGLVLGCDSVLFFNGEIYGKPSSEEIAIARWQKMRGNHGLLYTGHVLIDIAQDRTLSDCGITKVHFANISDKTIKAYVKSGEPLKCAGGFALEGKGGLFVEKIDGCHSNVIGLSYPLLRKMLTKLGYKLDFEQQKITRLQQE